MRIMRLLFALCGIASCSALGQSATPPSGTVSGHLYCADTHAPCRFGTVTIQSAPPAKDAAKVSAHSETHAYSAPTDIDGAFQINGVAPGDYFILGRFAGYVSPYDVLVNESKEEPSLNSPGLGYALNRITVDAGRTTISDLTMSRGGNIEGTVLYDDGSPAVNLPIHLFRKSADGKWKAYRNSSGNSTMAPLGLSDTQTDDRGRFYCPGLPPGTYTVDTNLREFQWQPATIVGRQSINVKFTKGDALKVYYGNKYREHEASPIELRSSEDRTGIDMTIPVSGLHTVQGTVTAKADGREIGRGTVRLLDPEDKTILRETDIQTDGSFAFHYVVNGSYLVEVNGKAQAPSVFEKITSPLLVDKDVTNLDYTLAAAHQD